MIQEKVIFVIPGFRQKTNSLAYKEIKKILRNAGFKPILVPVPWKNRTLSQNTDYFLKEYKKVGSSKKYILGFSYGAMIAFLASAQVSPNGLILCSLSPFFQEDIMGKRVYATSILAQKRIDDFSKFSSKTLAQNIKAKQVLMLYGREEAKMLIRRVTEAFSDLKTVKKKLIGIQKTEHNIGHKNYILTIHEAARNLF